MPRKSRNVLADGVPTEAVQKTRVLAAGNHDPVFSAPSLADAEKMNYDHDDDNELAFLKKMKYRSDIDQELQKYIPDINNLDAMTAHYLNIINGIQTAANPGGDDTAKAAFYRLEVLYARFGTRSNYNLARAIAKLKLEKAAVDEYDSLLESTDLSLGTKTAAILTNIKTIATGVKAQAAKPVRR